MKYVGDYTTWKHIIIIEKTLNQRKEKQNVRY